MGRLFVPISSSIDQDFDRTINELREIGTERVFLACGRLVLERGEHRTKRMKELKEIVDIYSKAGFEVAIWISTFGFGDPMTGRNVDIAKDYTRITSLYGVKMDDAICPLDKSFKAAITDVVEDIARYTGVKMIMLDDEMCLSVRPGIGCACELHMAELCRRLGEDIKREELPEKVFTGGQNKYRDAWYDVMADTMRDFCRGLREAVDKVDASIRLGFASGFTSWDLECADAVELTHILAGSTKPFVRLTGAPYWVSNQRFGRQTMQTILEFMRAQYVVCLKEGIEAFTEGDTYPRSNYHTSSSYAECYDIAARISDDMDSFKYHYVYSNHAYEKRFLEHHRRNMKLYEQIANAFNNKHATGIKVYEELRKFKNYDLPDSFIGENKLMKRVSFFDSQKLLTSNGIPTTYYGDGIGGIVFGENAKYVDLSVCNKGLILDAQAAYIFASRGIDTGIVSYETILARDELFENYENVETFGVSSVCKMELREGIKAQSYYDYNCEKIPASYLYENENGQRFLVLGFVGADQDDKSSMYWSYSRGEQIADSMKWLCGNELPARCTGHPHLYLLAKENDKSMAVGCINFHTDETFDATVRLSRDVENVRFINCQGKQADARTVVIDYINSNSFAGFEADFVAQQ